MRPTPCSFDRLSEFRGDAPFWGWLRQITVNESLMQLRRRGRFLGVDEFNEADFAAQDLLLPPRAADAAILSGGGLTANGRPAMLVVAYLPLSCRP